MAKTPNPLFSFRAFGSLGKSLTFKRHRGSQIIQGFPDHPDAKTTPQLEQRVMFQQCRDLWHTLTEAERATWESMARPFHMTGYNYYMSKCLAPNPGIYLPLAGGTMQGAIGMNSNRITDLPTPGANSDPARKQDLIDHAALTIGVHGLKGGASFSAYRTSGVSIPNMTHTLITWNAELWDVGGYMDLTNNRYFPTIPCKIVIIAAVRFTSGITDRTIYIYAYRSGGLYKMMGHTSVGSYSYPMVVGSCVMNMNGTTHYATIYVWHNNGSALTTYGGSSNIWFTGFVIPQ